MLNLQPRDIVRHPASGRIGMLIARGKYTADYQTANGVIYYVRLDELVPASFEDEAEYSADSYTAGIIFSGDVVRCAPDNALAVVLERTVSRVYVVGLYENANLATPVLGRDYWLSWMDADACVSYEDDAFEADAMEVVDMVLRRNTAAGEVA